MNLGRFIKIERIKRGWTQADLAKHSGISKRAICYYENGTYTPYQENITKLANVFKIKEEQIKSKIK